MIPAIEWKKSPTGSLTLTSGELHLWKIDLNETADGDMALLSPDEQKRYNRFKISVEQRRFLSARSQMRRILARYIDCPAGSIRFDYNDKGKPTVISPATTIKFNLSHAEDLALLVVSPGIEVGIDLERVRMRASYRRIARRVFDSKTSTMLAELDEGVFANTFLYHWTILEARVKAIGAGVFDYPENIDALSARSFVPADEWVAAVAGIGRLPEIREWLALVSGRENNS